MYGSMGVEVTPTEFHQDFWRKKARVHVQMTQMAQMALFAFSHFGTIPVCDERTARRTDGHMTTAYT